MDSGSGSRGSRTTAGSSSDDGWGEVTPVRSGSPRGNGRPGNGGSARPSAPASRAAGSPADPPRRSAGWSPRGGGLDLDDRATHGRGVTDRDGHTSRDGRDGRDSASADDPWLSGDGSESPLRPRLPAERQRGLPAWAALVALLAICAIGVIIDEITNSTSRTGFNVAIIVASFVAIVLVRRSAMFPIVVSPPLVYCIVSGVLLYVHSNGLKDHAALFDAGVNWLVYGFPAIAGATAAVLIVGGIRLVTRR